MKRRRITILLPEIRGFCFGVRRAIRKTVEILRTTTAYSLGPLIHNRRVVDDLKNKGLVVIKSMKELPQDAPFIVRSHGISRRKYDEALKRGARIVDLTCPFVKRAREFAEKESIKGRTILIAGDPAHPEVRGIVSFCKGRCIVVKTADEIEEIPPYEKVSLLGQTTFIPHEFEKIRSRAVKRFSDLEVFNSICDSTSLRQEEARRLAMNVDFMLVVGGKNSANTTHLFEISRDICPAIHIEVPFEIDPRTMDGVRTIGLIGGASTPEDALFEVIDFLKGFFDIKISNLS